MTDIIDIIIKKINEIKTNIFKENKRLAISTVSIMGAQSIFYFYVKQKFSRKIILFAFANQILLLYSLYKKNYFVKEITHMGFGATIILILLFSKNKILNKVNNALLMYTIATRKFYNGCMFLQCSSAETVDFLPDINYDIVYSTLFLLQSFKNVYYFF